MPSMFGICPQRRTSLLGWLFGNSKHRVAVAFAAHNADEDPGRAATNDSNIIVKARNSYNLRPRRKAISYKEPEDPEDA